MNTAKSMEEQIKELFGERTEISGRDREYGGDINEAFCLTLSDGRKIFMKRNPRQPSAFFEAEALGLEALREAAGQQEGGIRIPRVYAVCPEPSGGSCLLMEYISTERPRGDFWERFGRQLAGLHRAAVSGPYGFPSDNFIGETAQINTQKKTWADFYRECRLEPQIRMAGHFFDAKARRQAARLIDGLDRWIEEPAFPSVLHGDLWGGNAMCSRQQEPVLIDPAAYIGHFETDLAMTELFGGFPEAFYQSYREANPIPPGYRERRDLYQLYHLLNHLNLFGRTYYGAVSSILQRYGT